MKRNWRQLAVDLLEPSQERRHPWLLPYILLSVVLHLVLVIVIHQLKTAMPEALPTAIEVVPLIEEKNQYRIADIEKPALEKRPAPAKNIGMYDSSVPAEMVASGSGGGGGARGEHGKDLAAKPATQPAEKTLDQLLHVDRNLFATHAPGDTEGKNGASRLEDFYPDYRQGAHTYLNVMRFPEVEYFVRLKRAFKLTFNPGPALQRSFLNNQIARGSVEVVMAVAVDREGTLAELFVIRSSGIAEYDAEGLRTVRASAPFPHPPEKFLAADGLLRMSWTFTVYL